MYDIEKRRNQVASSILENERLTADLNDETADLLLQWSLTLAEKIVTDSQHLDDDQAEEAMYAPMKALRRMMRAINKWVSSGEQRYLEGVLKQAPIIYGETAVIPPIEALADVQTIPTLRQALEYTPTQSATNNPTSHQGKENDKEEVNLEQSQNQ